MGLMLGLMLDSIIEGLPLAVTRPIPDPRLSARSGLARPPSMAPGDEARRRRAPGARMQNVLAPHAVIPAFSARNASSIHRG
jgi:hypothetical protein